MIQIARSLLIAPRIETSTARKHVHDKSDPTCTTCNLPWTDTCEKQNHTRHQTDVVTLTDEAPEEARRAHLLYGEMWRKFHGLGYAVGRQIYLLHSNRRPELDALVAEAEAKLAEFNASCQRVEMKFDVKVVEIAPEAAALETIKSIQRDVEGAVARLTEALHSGDLRVIRQVVRDTANAAQLVEGRASAELVELSKFAKKAADRLRAAAKESEDQVVEAKAEAKRGAVRFATIFGDLFAEAQPAAEVAVAG